MERTSNPVVEADQTFDQQPRVLEELCSVNF